ncbi:MAG: hypothetical protein MJZ59_04410 [Paludibacteraceae bacterium]|nr:hypothetical protein [Paludibacteraceae bacterium]
MKKTYIMPQTATVQFDMADIMWASAETSGGNIMPNTAPARQSGKIAGSLYI